MNDYQVMAIKQRSDTLKKPPRTRNSASTEDRILVAAENLFAQNGYDAVTTKQLASKAGVAIGAIYHHFPSKEAIYAAATKRLFSNKSTPPSGIIDAPKSPEWKITELVTWFVRLMMLDKNFGMLLRREMLDPRPSTPDFVASGLFKESLMLFKDLILQVEPRANADEAIASILALMFGFTNLKGIYSLFPEVRKTLETPEEIAEYVTHLMLRGLKTDPL